MEISAAATVVICILVGILLALGCRVMNWVWLRPRKLENHLRQQGLAGNSYRFLVGDATEYAEMYREAISKPMKFSHDIAPRLIPLVHQTVQNYGKNSFMWAGPCPRVNIMDPEQIKTAFSLIDDIQKPDVNPILKLLAEGLIWREGANWVKHRKIVNPAFHLEKLKEMVPTFLKSCSEMVDEWETLTSEKGSCELDVMPHLHTLTTDVISRTAFGSCFEEGKRIFMLQKEMVDLVTQASLGVYIPGWRFLPTKLNRKIKGIDKEIKELLFKLVSKRQKAMMAGEATNTDLLGLLMESNFREIREHGNNKKAGMTIADVVQECKLFYLAGQETTATLLVWTMILLSSNPEWQERARAEVFEVFGHNKPDTDGLSRLKLVTMILNESLRLYPPVGILDRSVRKEMKLGKLNIPAGVMLSFPTVLIHHDHQLWGEDAHEFNPERFSEGVSKATKNQTSFLPFGWGPRSCIGQNFALIEAKMVMAMILQRFSFELSPSYTHAPTILVTTQPQHGAHIILHKL